MDQQQMSSKANHYALLRASFDQEAALHEADPAHHENTIWETIKGIVPALNDWYCSKSGNSGTTAEFDDNLHDLWYGFIVAAQITAADSPEQDRLVGLVISTRERGTLKRAQNQEEAVTTVGKVWTDLPWFFDDLRSMWMEKTVSMTSKHRVNLASFMARLVASGVGKRDLDVCALWAFREALELRRTAQSTEERSSLTVNLLPVCFIWLKYCAHKLLQFSMEKQQCEVELAPGKLALAAGVTESGFTLARWLFWRDMYKELSRSDDADLAAYGENGFNLMVTTGLGAGYGLEIPGERNYWNKVKEALSEELKKSGREVVDGEDIFIDKEWASI